MAQIIADPAVLQERVALLAQAIDTTIYVDLTVSLPRGLVDYLQHMCEKMGGADDYLLMRTLVEAALIAYTGYGGGSSMSDFATPIVRPTN